MAAGFEGASSPIGIDEDGRERHKTIATLRADGSPRISGIECEFTERDLRFGSMTGARKGADLERDPRLALHGPTFHPEEGQENDWPGGGEDRRTSHRRRPGDDGRGERATCRGDVHC